MIKCLFPKFYFFPKIKSAVALQNASTEHSVADPETKGTWRRKKKKKETIYKKSIRLLITAIFFLTSFYRRRKWGFGDIVHWPSMNPLPTPIIAADRRLKLNNVEIGRERYKYQCPTSRQICAVPSIFH